MYLTHLDYQDTERIMTEKLQNQVNGSEWSWKNLNTVSLAFDEVVSRSLAEIRVACNSFCLQPSSSDIPQRPEHQTRGHF